MQGYGPDMVTVLEGITDAFFALDDEWRFVYVNRKAERVLAREKEELLGQNVWDEFPEAVGSKFYKHYHEAVRERATAEFEEYYPPLGKWFEVKAYPSVAGLSVFFHDISERKRAKKELGEYEERLRAILVQYGTDIITILEADGTIRYESPAIQKVLGHGPADLVGTNVLDHIHPDDVGRARSELGNVLQDPGARRPVQVRFRHADGSWRHLEGVGNNLLSDPSVKGIVINSRDVTERERAEEEIRFQARLLDAVGQAVVVVDLRGRIAYWNRAAEELYGWSAEEAVGRPAPEVMVSEDQMERAGEIWAELSAGRSWSGEFVVRRRDGSSFPALVTDTPVRDERGNTVGMIGVSTDVTERKRAEEALKESEERYRAIFERSMDGIFLFDGHARRAIDANPALHGMLGYAPGELRGMNIHDLIAHDPEEVDRNARLALREGQRLVGDRKYRKKDGSVLDVEVLASTIPHQGGEVVCAIVRNVTERKRAEEVLRRTEELLGRPAYELLLSKEQCPGMLERNRRRLEGVAERYEMRLKRKDGTRFWAEVNATPYRDASGEIVGTLGALTDVTERKEAEEALEESEKLFRQLFEQSSDALLVHDEAGMMIDCNSEACRSLGYSREELLALSVEDFGIKLVSDEEGVDKDRMLWQRVTAGELGTVTGVVLGMHRRKDGTTFPIEVGLSGIDYGGRRLILASCRDLTEREALEERLTHQAFHDFLTGLPNRALFSDRLKQALVRRERAGSRVAVLFMDLDNFKYVNDSLGHDAGDRLLAAAAGRLKGCVRPEDTVARLGGDEFAVVIEAARDLCDAIRVAQRAVQAFGEPFDLGGREVFAGTSVGIALGEAGRDRPEDLLRKADLALYEAKRGGKARYAVFDPEAERRSLRRLELENGLRRALERDEFGVRYQPVVSLRNGQVAGFEALLRWEHPERGLVPAGEFVPLAEENGLIVPIGLRILHEACRQAKGWQELCPNKTPPTVWVNLSAAQFRHPDLVGHVAGALDEAGLDPGRLSLEVTESVLVEDAGRHAGTLRGLKELGVRFAIDDFGTGYSALSYLKSLPAGVLKLDGSFVGGIGEGSGEDEVLLEGVIGIAHGLGLTVCAEGVETPEQAARLREFGCDLAQGNHFSGPLTSEEAAEVLASGPRRSS